MYQIDVQVLEWFLFATVINDHYKTEMAELGVPLTPPRAVAGSENPGGGEASSDVSGHNLHPGG